MARLQLKTVRIENFGPFREPQTFDLCVTHGRPVVLVTALNGSGKTTFLTALQLVLYGQRGLVEARTRPMYESLIRGLLRKDVSGPAAIEVVMDISFGETRNEYRVHRSWHMSGTDLLENVSVHVDGEVDPALGGEWLDFIEGLLPAELLDLFFFDGEKIEALANPDRLPTLLRQAIEGFFGLGAIDALSSNLRNLERRLERDNIEPDVDAKIEELESKLKEEHARIAQHVQELAAAHNELDHANRELQRYTAEARRSGLESLKKAEALRHDLAQRKESVTQIVSEVHEALADPLLPLAWLGTFWGDFKSAYEQSETGRQTAELANIMRKRDTRILRQLGELLPAKNKDVIAGILKQDLDRLQSEAKAAGIKLEPTDSPEQYEVHVAEKLEVLRTLMRHAEKSRKAVDVAEAKVLNIPSEDQLGNVLETLKMLSTAQASAEVRMHALENALAHSRRVASEISCNLENFLTETRQARHGATLTGKAIASGERARQALGLFKSRLTGAKAEALATRISTEFIRLSRKQRLISKVDIDPFTFEVHIKNKQGSQLPLERLSAGERQLLATAVLSALIRERKSPFPVVVDTPLARLDQDHRLKLVEGFFADVSHQVIVLSTDQEVAGATYQHIMPYLSQELSLVFDEAMASSRVKATNSAQLPIGEAA